MSAMPWGHPYDARPHIERALDDITTAEAFGRSYHDDYEPEYPSEVFGRLRAARKELNAALASAEETERQRFQRAHRRKARA